MCIVQLTNHISYIKSIQHPLSSDVGIIQGKEFTWLFDVGSHQTVIEALEAIPGKKKVVLSHFHPDHITNISKISYADLYVSRHTYRYTNKGTIVEKNLMFDDGVELYVFELPSSHAKGSMGLQIDNTYAFLGDGIYSTMKNGKVCYNTNLLKEEIQVLKSLEAKYFLLSHDEKFIYDRQEVISMLEEIYVLRTPQSAYIYLENK